MTMKLTLDTKALRALINDNPETKLELSRAVVAEVVRNTVVKDTKLLTELLAPSALAETLTEMKIHEQVEATLVQSIKDFLAKGSWAWNSGPKGLSVEAQNRVSATVKKAAEDVLNSLIDEKWEELLVDLERRVARRLDTSLENYFQRNVSEEVRRRIAAAAANG